MRIFALEYVTAGGWRECPALAALVAEGGMMLRALARDLSSIAGVEVVVAHDADLGLDGIPARRETIDPCDPWGSWRRIAAQVDAVWPIAPETDGLLEAATAMAASAGRLVLGSCCDALATARSKRATAEHLARFGVPVPPTTAPDQPPPSAAGWVVKPDDGAGASDTHLLPDRAALDNWRARHANGIFVVQPFLAGIPTSLSVLVQDGAAWLLSCNLQRMTCENGAFAYRGSLVGGAEARRTAMEPLATAIAAALPALWGYVGIDLIDGRDGPTVLEINPRLTTSYVGLGESLGVNPAELVLALHGRPLASLVRPLAHRPVEIAVPSS